jgi:hypothetical protein
LAPRIAASKKLPRAADGRARGRGKALYATGVSALARALCVASLVALCACSNTSNEPVVSSIYGTCTSVDASATCVGDAGFDATIVPIIAKSCLKSCHDDSPDAAWPLTDYDDVHAWAEYIAQDLLQCTMPPVNAGPSYPITREDRETILNWIVCGAPP